MTSSGTNKPRVGHHSWIAILLFFVAMSVLTATEARADDCVKDRKGVIDGYVNPVPPSQIQIDGNCTIRNFPASNPLTSNISFFTRPGQTNERWLIIFDNVVHTGNMSCNAVLGHKIWFTNGSSSKIKANCQNLLIPVEKIVKQNPAGQTTAAIGIPFTYKLTIPVLFDPATGTVINNNGSPNDLHGITVWDDLNATGADLSYVSHVAYWLSDHTPIPHTFSNTGGFLTFDGFPVVPAGRQFVIEVTVVLRDTPGNVPGKQFINTAKWDFGRLIDGVYYEPLPGEWGVTPPMTIAAPVLVVTKSGPATMNLGQWGDFGIDVRNTGTIDAWDITLRDLLPKGAAGGMCDRTPEILSARVYAADGVTPVAGKGPLTPGSDYSLSYSPAPNCRLEITTLTPAGRVGPNERLIVRYRTQLDADTQNGVALTNIAGAVQWFNGDSSIASRKASTRTLTNGTPGILDHEDAHTVTTAVTGNFFEKTVADLTSGMNPATTAAPGDKLRYTLRVRTTNQALSNFRIFDELDGLNPQADFAPGTLTLVSYPPGADVSATSSTGGAKGTGIIDIRNLNLPVNTQVMIQFDIRLASTLTNGTVVTNQSTLRLANGAVILSDDPNVNGVANPDIPGDEDPTRVTIVTTPLSYFFEKTAANLTTGANPTTTAAPGDKLRYTLRFRTNQALNNFTIHDEVDSLNAQPAFVPGTLTLVSSPTGADVSGTSSTGGAKGTGVIDIRNLNVAANGEVVIQFDIALLSTLTNGIVVTNQSTLRRADGAVFSLSDDPNVNGPAKPDVSGDEDPTRVTIVTTPLSYFFEKTAANLTTGANPTTTAAPGDKLRYTLRFRTNEALNNFSIHDEVDSLNAQPAFVPGTLTLVTSPAGGDISGTSSTGGTKGTGVIDIRGLNVAANGEVVIQFDITLLSTLTNGIVVTNQSALRRADGAVFSLSDDPNVNGPAKPDVSGDEDPTRVTIVTTPLSYVFEKTAANLTSGANPTTTAAPGDKLRYTLRFRTNQALNNFSIHDEVDSLNAQPAFVPGTLTLVTSPAGADISGTSSTGGTKGTGVIDIRGLNVAANSEVVIQFDITLLSTLTNGAVVTNQSALRRSDGSLFSLSDDPNVNGPAKPDVSGDEDPTRVTIVSGPRFLVQKVSTDRTGDPNVLLAGETLRYTITVKNIGNADAVNVVLRDVVPENTTYVAGSTTLNAAQVADSAGLSPLVNGMAINSPANATPGSMPAGASSSQANVATVTFDVVVNPNVANGTVISNQGFVTAAGSGIVDYPSDDPRTPIPDDPTRDVVGNFPLLYAEKRVALSVDRGSPGIVDPGDVLRYTITVQNSAAIPATGVVLRDSVPANTTYVANSTLLNGLPVSQPDNGVSPLASGINISSSDLTPPVPGAGAGTISPKTTAVLQFDLRVNDGTSAGTLISNQAVVNSAELPNLLTDGDGDPANGPQPTVVIVGAGQQVSITNQVSVVGGGAAVPGAQLEYVVRVVNIAAVPTLHVVITDNLGASQPGQLAFVNGSATMNGSAAGVTFSGSTITGNYAALSGPLQPGEDVTLRFRATLAPGLTSGTVVTNTAVVEWNDPAQTESASASITVGGISGLATLNGAIWHDANFDNTRDSGERGLAGWAVDLYRGGQLVNSALTDAAGAYSIIDVEPNDTSRIPYELRFRAPGAGASTAMLGLAASPFTNGMQRITDVIVPSGANLVGLNLPIHPNGVVYDSSARTPISGATLTLLDAAGASPLPAACFDDAAQQGQITLADGYYKFDINFSDPACPSGGEYLIGVTAPSGMNYVPGYSQIIPPASNASTAPFSVPACPGSSNDAIAATAMFCEVQASEFAPAASIAPRSAGTIYHIHLRLDGSGMPGTSQIFNNHIPLDPQITGSLAISKTTPLLNVTRGQLVPYVITVNNPAGLLLADVRIVDRLPAGFTYVPGSALLDGAPSEPSFEGRALSWNGLTIAGAQARSVKLLIAVGAGVTEGEYVNHAQAVNAAGTPISGEATATVRVVPDPTFDCTDVTGKVFNDVNRNGMQDDGENGLPGVRVVTAQGLEATTDPFGRYHITCAITPHESRGSNFVLKLDDRTLPSGFRMSTDLMQIKHVTRGKAMRINFGASIHRVVGIDLSDAVFEPGKTEMRIQWRPRLNVLLEELRKGPAVLRLSYVADTEDAALVERRVQAVKRQLTESWNAAKDSHVLAIEHEVFWRRGAPPKRPDVRVPKSR